MRSPIPTLPSRSSLLAHRAAILAIAAALAAGAPACALEESAPAELSFQESSIADAKDPPISVLHETFSNWYTGGARGAEQGTNGSFGPGDCPTGAVVVGVQYFEGGGADWVDGIGVACWGPSAGYTFSNWYSGGVRGAEQGTHGGGMGLCPWGRFVTGLKYYEGAPGDAIDGLGVQCGEPRSISNWAPDQSTTEQGNGTAALGACPTDHVVVGIQAFQGTAGTEDWLDGIGMHCAHRPW